MRQLLVTTANDWKDQRAAENTNRGCITHQILLSRNSAIHERICNRRANAVPVANRCEKMLSSATNRARTSSFCDTTTWRRGNLGLSLITPRWAREARERLPQ